MLSSLPVADASSVQRVAFSEMANAAELIFEGEVVAVQSGWNASNSRIYTYVDFRVADVVKGNIATLTDDGNFRLRFLGGQVGENVLQVDGLVYPVFGERGIYFVENLSKPQANPLLGWSQGHYTFDDNNIMHSNRAEPLELDLPQKNMQDEDKSNRFIKLSNGIATGLKPTTNTAEAGVLTKIEFKRQVRVSLRP